MTGRKVAGVLPGLVLAGIFLWLLLRQVALDELKAALAAASVPLVLAALAAFCVGYACRIERWRVMLAADNPALHWRHCAGPFLASVAANNVLPLRAGDVMRAFAFNARLQVGAATAVSTLIVERLLDLLLTAALLGLGLAWFGIDSSRLIGVGAAVVIAAALAILFILLLPSVFRPPAQALGRLAARALPKIGSGAAREIDKAFTALERMARGSTMTKLVAWSALAWIAEGCVFWFAARALPGIGEPLGAWIALPVGTLATVIPSTPGYAGTFDFFTAKAMTASGNAPAAATAFALLVHALLWLPPTLAGGIYQLLHPLARIDKPDRASA